MSAPITTTSELPVEPPVTSTPPSTTTPTSNALSSLTPESSTTPGSSSIPESSSSGFASSTVLPSSSVSTGAVTPDYIDNPTITMNIPDTPLLTLPTTWTPPSSCLDTTQVNNVVATDESGTKWYDYVFGYPSLQDLPLEVAPTSDCLPPSYDDSVPYITDGDCPASYTEVYRYRGQTYQSQVVDVVTCCPSVNDPSWKFQAWDTSSHYSYGCSMQVSKGFPLTGNFVGDSVVKSMTTTMDNDWHIIAYGVTMVSTTPASETGTSTNKNNNESGLTTGAQAGIGVGVAAGVIGIIGAAFFIFRSRRRRLAQRTSDASFEDQPVSNRKPETIENQKYLLIPPAEMPAYSRPSELSAQQERQHELP